MAKFRGIPSGSFLSEGTKKISDKALEKNVILVYAGKFESMDGPVEVTDEHVSSLASNHNGRLAKLKRMAGSGLEFRMGDCPPVQLDHSRLAQHTVGRLVGDIWEARVTIEEPDGSTSDRNAVCGRVRFLGADNVEAAEDGRYTHFSIGADLSEPKSSRINELSVTPFPAAANATYLSAKEESPMKLFDLENKDGQRLARWHKDSGDAYGYLDECEVAEIDDNNYMVIGKNPEGSGFVWEVASVEGPASVSPHGSGTMPTSREAKNAAEAKARSKGFKLSAELSWKKLASETVNQDGMKKVRVEDTGTSYDVLVESDGGFVNKVDSFTYNDVDSKAQAKKMADASMANAAEHPEASVSRLAAKGEKYTIDWDGPSKVVVLEIRGDKALVARVGDEDGDQQLVPVSELKKKLSEGDKMDPKERLKKHLMEEKKMSAEEADKCMAALTEDEEKKLSAEVDEKEKKMSEEADKDKKDGDAKMSAAKTELKRLSSDFRASAKGANLTAKKASIGVRLSKLRAQALMTPAEQKSISVDELALKTDGEVDAFFKGFEFRQPVIPVKMYGSVKAMPLSEVAAPDEDALLAESAANMGFTGKAIMKRLGMGKKADDQKGIQRIDTSRLSFGGEETQVNLSAFVEVQKLLEAGKADEAKSAMRLAMNGAATDPNSGVSQEAHLSALAENVKQLQNQFESLLKLVGPVLGVSPDELA